MTVKRRRALVSEGIVDTQEAQELIQDATSALPDLVQERRNARIASEQAEKRQAEQQMRAEEAVKVFKERWVVAKEWELYQLQQKKLRVQGNGDLARSLESLIQISEDKIRQYHELRGTITQEAIEERRKFCVSKGYVEENDARLIENVFGRMPLATVPTPPWSEPEQDVQDIPKTPSWSPRPDRTPLRSWFFSPRTTPEIDIDISKPPKTPSYGRPKKRRVEVTEVSQKKTKKRSVVDYYH